MPSESSKIVIVSNRLPVHRVEHNGNSEWETSPGGLVSALRPILRQHPSTWIGWTGIPGDATEPFDHDGIRNHPVILTSDEVETFYEGFSNRTLWPLYHDAIRTPEYRRKWWEPYRRINERFADAAADVVGDNGVIWVHDYHLQLVPAMVRKRRPDVNIGFFLHIPFPPRELFAQLPWRQPILAGLLGSDVVGFQSRLGAQNFAQLAKRYTRAEGPWDQLRYNGRNVRVHEFPVSIDYAQFEKLAADEQIVTRANEFRSRLGGARRVLLGVDRLDYTKGIDIRLRAYRDLLQAGRLNPQECVLVQVAVPSRERVEEYKRLRSEVERLVGEINGQFGELGRTPVHYLHRSLPRDELVALYLAADVMLVTPLRDGMNLVAKEYVASRLDHRGVLVLSEFTGSANELDQALLVNPHDIDALANAIDRAFHMTDDDQAKRMRALRKVVREHDVYHWANSFLEYLTA